MDPMECVLLGSSLYKHLYVSGLLCSEAASGGARGPSKVPMQLSQEGYKSNNNPLCTAIGLLIRRGKLGQPHADFSSFPT